MYRTEIAKCYMLDQEVTDSHRSPSQLRLGLLLLEHSLCDEPALDFPGGGLGHDIGEKDLPWLVAAPEVFRLYVPF